jgi:F-type H+-transporting ATPase subunit a
VHDLSNVGPRKILGFFDGKIFVTESVLFGLIVAAILVILAFFLTSRMEKVPRGKQIVAETIVDFIYNLVGNGMGKHNIRFAPYIGTVIIFLVFANATGLFGFRPVTADVNMTFAMSTITFMVIQASSMRNNGIGGYAKHMCKPFPFMLPINILEQFTLPVSLGFRLFGNITGGMIIMALIFNALGNASAALHLPIPFLQAVIPMPANFFFDVFEPVLQAYIFTMLTMTFLAKELPKPGEAH